MALYLAEGMHVFCYKNIFVAVYFTNLLRRSSDVLLTKPCELAFYTIQKRFLKRIGGHEKWDAIRNLPHPYLLIQNKLFSFPPCPKISSRRNNKIESEIHLRFLSLISFIITAIYNAIRNTVTAARTSPATGCTYSNKK